MKKPMALSLQRAAAIILAIVLGASALAGCGGGAGNATTAAKASDDSKAAATTAATTADDGKSLSGRYYIFSMTDKQGGETHDADQLAKDGMTRKNTHFDFKDGGKCTIVFVGDKSDGTYTRDGKKISLGDADGDMKEGTVDGDTITLEDEVFQMVLKKIPDGEIEEDGGDDDEGGGSGSSGSGSSRDGGAGSDANSAADNAAAQAAENAAKKTAFLGRKAGALKEYDIEYFTVGFPPSVEYNGSILGTMEFNEKDGWYKFTFTGDSLDKLEDRRWALANGNNWISDFTEFKQDIGGLEDVYSIKFNRPDIASANAYYSFVLPRPVQTQYGEAGIVTAHIESAVEGMEIDDLLAMPEVKAILASIKFKEPSEAEKAAQAAAAEAAAKAEAAEAAAAEAAAKAKAAAAAAVTELEAKQSVVLMESEEYGNIKLRIPKGIEAEVEVAEPGEPDLDVLASDMYFLHRRAYIKCEGFGMMLGYEVCMQPNDRSLSSNYPSWDMYSRAHKNSSNCQEITIAGNECWTSALNGHIMLFFPATTALGGRAIDVFPEGYPDAKISKEELWELIELPEVQAILETLELSGEYRDDMPAYPMDIDNEYFSFTVKDGWEILTYRKDDYELITCDESYAIKKKSARYYTADAQACTTITYENRTAEEDAAYIIDRKSSCEKGENLTIGGVEYFTVKKSDRDDIYLVADRPPKSDGKSNGCIRILFQNCLPDESNPMLATLVIK